MANPPQEIDEFLHRLLNREGTPSVEDEGAQEDTLLDGIVQRLNSLLRRLCFRRSSSPSLERDQQDNSLDGTVQRLNSLLRKLCFSQSSSLSLTLSWTAFFVCVGLQVLVFWPSDSEKYLLKALELGWHTIIVSFSLFWLSRELREYGIQNFLFVRGYGNDMPNLHDKYCEKISASFVVQGIGIVLCLCAATKLSHKAQHIALIASRWHALITCSSTEASQLGDSDSVENIQAANPFGSANTNYTESDLESLECAVSPTTYDSFECHKRQAFVSYLQTNPGGITIFGFTVDRALICTMISIKLTLVTFVLGKTLSG